MSHAPAFIAGNNSTVRGRAVLRRRKPIAHSHPRKTAPEVIDKILELRREYRLGALGIVYYLAHDHRIKISESPVSHMLRAHGENRLPKTAPRRTVHSKRYAKTVPGHHVQVDVKFLQLNDADGKLVKRYQYTAIDDASRIRALRVFAPHNQESAIQFIDYVIEKFPFRISTVRTDRGHEFQAPFHWHMEDQGMQHVYIKPRTPQLNGKVERSHRTDQAEFYQLLTYTDDVDLNIKLEAWESFYNYHRLHISLTENVRGDNMNFIFGSQHRPHIFGLLSSLKIYLKLQIADQTGADVLSFIWG